MDILSSKSGIIVPPSFLSSMRASIISSNNYVSNERSYDSNVNCYSAALGVMECYDIDFVTNFDLKETWYTPGIMSGNLLRKYFLPNDLNYSFCSDMDAIGIPTKLSDYDTALGPDEKLIAMFYRYCPNSEYTDYHFMWRGAKDSTWFHKIGAGTNIEEVTNPADYDSYSCDMGCYKLRLK
jgi:hypothetical protein